MSRYNDELKLKLAWQTAYEQRTCPPAEILYAEHTNQDLGQHLAFCDSCRESRAIAKDGTTGAQGFFASLRLNKLPQESTAAKQSGQIWTLDKNLCRWQEGGRYFSPPTVLLLSESGTGYEWKVSQLYSDKRLMSDGDVFLDDRFGFAQGWNTYTIPTDLLQCWLGNATEAQVAETIAAGTMQKTPLDDDSILSFFRQMERDVGEKVATSNIPTIESVLEGIFGSIAAVYNKLSRFNLPECADSLLELLAGASDPHAVIPVLASTNIPLLVNIIIKQSDGAITIKSVGATLTDNIWEDGDYYVAGKLNEVQSEDLILLASLHMNGKVLCEHQSHIEKDSPYFDIVFKSAAEEAGSIDNLKFILVKP